MSNTAQASITITAAPAVVWDALTNPELIKQYMFGTNTTSDWKKGSPVTYKGEWEGKAYEDKGVILEVEPNHLLVMDYYSPSSGKADTPENHQRLTYKLDAQEDKTTLTIIQENNPSAEAAQKSTQNWQYILQAVKQLLEGN